MRAVSKTDSTCPLRLASGAPRICAHALLVAGTLMAAPQSIVSAQELPENIQRCASESDEARRLACYDREVARSTPKAATSAATQAPPTAALPPEETFGLDKEQMRRKQEVQEAPKLERLTATVAKVARRAHGELLLTLDNGQVWAEKQATSFTVKEGEAVTIKAAALGSYLMTNSSGRSSRVTRVR